MDSSLVFIGVKCFASPVEFKKKYTEPHATSCLFLEFCHHFATLSSVHIPIGNWHLAIRLLSGVSLVDLTSVLRVNTTQSQVFSSIRDLKRWIGGV